VNAAIVQFKLTSFTVPFQILFGLMIAMYIKNNIRSGWLIQLSRNVIIIPMVIPPIVAAIIWKILFTPQVSILSYLIESIGLGRLDWLGDPNRALIAVSIAQIWAQLPFCFLLIYAALMSFPTEPFEAAEVDGANWWQIFRHITLPMLRPTLSIVFLFELVDSLRAFPFIFGMTDGGPGFVTEPPNYYAYREAFSYSHVGYSSTMIVILLGFSLLLAYVVMKNIRWNQGEI
jgi:multiple sugar transport system permease protein